MHDDHDFVHKAPWNDGRRNSVAKYSQKQQEQLIVAVEKDPTQQGSRQVPHGIGRHEGGSPFYSGGGDDL